MISRSSPATCHPRFPGSSLWSSHRRFGRFARTPAGTGPGCKVVDRHPPGAVPFAPVLDDGQCRFGVSHVRVPPPTNHQVTCPTLPCARFSRVRTTIGAPSPWGSRPLGDPDFPICSSDNVVRSSTHPYARVYLPRYLAVRTCRCISQLPGAWGRHMATSRWVSIATGLRRARSGLDFKQFSLDHTTRVLRDVWLC